MEELTEWLENAEVKGECCIIIEGNRLEDEEEESAWWKDLTLLEHVLHNGKRLFHQRSNQARRANIQKRRYQAQDNQGKLNFISNKKRGPVSVFSYHYFAVKLF